MGGSLSMREDKSNGIVFRDMSVQPQIGHETANTTFLTEHVAYRLDFGRLPASSPSFFLGVARYAFSKSGRQTA